MSYEVNDDEVAIILRPVDADENGDWTGELSTGLVVGKSNKFKIEVLSYLVHLATLMGTFLELSQEDEDLYNEVEGTEGKVLKLTKYTKTFGNA